MEILQDKVIDPLRSAFVRTARIMKPVMHFAGLFNEDIADFAEYVDPALDIGLAVSTGGLSAADDYIVRSQPWMDSPKSWTDTRGTKWHYRTDRIKTTPPLQPPRPRINPRPPKRNKFNRPNRPPNIITSGSGFRPGARPPLPPRQSSAPIRRNSDPFGKRKGGGKRRSSFNSAMAYRDAKPFYDTNSSESPLAYSSGASFYSSESSPELSNRLNKFRF